MERVSRKKRKQGISTRTIIILAVLSIAITIVLSTISKDNSIYVKNIDFETQLDNDVHVIFDIINEIPVRQFCNITVRVDEDEYKDYVQVESLSTTNHRVPVHMPYGKTGVDVLYWCSS